MSHQFKPGEIVDITIKGARVKRALSGPGYLTVVIAGVLENIHIALEGVTVERVAPAEWPPRAGDLWRDRHGELWFIFQNPSALSALPHLKGRTATGERWTDDALGLINDGNAPLTLVHREGNQS